MSGCSPITSPPSSPENRQQDGKHNKGNKSTRDEHNPRLQRRRQAPHGGIHFKVKALRHAQEHPRQIARLLSTATMCRRTGGKCPASSMAAATGLPLAHQVAHLSHGIEVTRLDGRLPGNLERVEDGAPPPPRSVPQRARPNG